MIMLMVNYEKAKPGDKDILVISLKNKLTNPEATIYFKELIRVVNDISNSIWGNDLINFTVGQMKSYSTKTNSFNLIMNFFMKMGQALFNELDKPINNFIRELLRPHKLGIDGLTIQYHTNSMTLRGGNQANIFLNKIREGRLQKLMEGNNVEEIREGEGGQAAVVEEIVVDQND